MATEKFHYTIPGTKQKITLPRFGNVPFGLLRKIRKESEGEQVFSLFEGLADKGLILEADMDQLDNLDMDGAGVLLEAWQSGESVTLGE